MVPKVDIVGSSHDSIGMPFGIPEGATFTSGKRGTETGRYFELLVNAQKYHVRRTVTVTMVPEATESIEGFAYSRMARDAEVVAENIAHRARLKRRGRDRSDD